MLPRYNWDDFEEHLLDFSTPGFPEYAGAPGNLQLNPKAQPPFEKWEALMENDRKFKLSWFRQRKDMEDQSASAYDMSIVSITVLSGWSDQEIVDTVIAFRRKHKEDLKLRQDYYHRTIVKARKEHKHETAVNELEATMSAKPETEESAGDKRAQILARVREALTVPVVRVIKYTNQDRESEYELVLEEHSIRLGSVNGILNPRLFQSKVADACGTVIPNFKLDRWRIVAQGLMQLCEEREMGTSTTDSGALQDWLRHYLRDHKPAARTPENIESRVPILIDDRPHVFLGEFREWLGRAKSEHLTSKELGVRMRRLGSAPVVVRHVCQGKETSRELWPVPVTE